MVNDYKKLKYYGKKVNGIIVDKQFKNNDCTIQYEFVYSYQSNQYIVRDLKLNINKSDDNNKYNINHSISIIYLKNEKQFLQKYQHKLTWIDLFKQNWVSWLFIVAFFSTSFGLGINFSLQFSIWFIVWIGSTSFILILGLLQLYLCSSNSKRSPVEGTHIKINGDINNYVFKYHSNDENIDGWGKKYGNKTYGGQQYIHENVNITGIRLWYSKYAIYAIQIRTFNDWRPKIGNTNSMDVETKEFLLQKNENIISIKCQTFLNRIEKLLFITNFERKCNCPNDFNDLNVDSEPNNPEHVWIGFKAKTNKVLDSLQFQFGSTKQMIFIEP